MHIYGNISFRQCACQTVPLYTLLLTCQGLCMTQGFSMKAIYAVLWNEVELDRFKKVMLNCNKCQHFETPK